TVFGKPVCRLFNPRVDPCSEERNRIHSRLPGKLEFLFRIQGGSIVDIADVEVGNDGEYSLLLLLFDLGFGNFRSGGRDPYLGLHGSDRKDNWTNNVSLAVA